MTLKKSLKSSGVFLSLMEIDPAEVIYCKADGSYTDICFKTGRVKKFSQNLKFISGLLPGKKFLRCHHSYLVNRDEITGFDIPGRKLLLCERFSVPVSRRKFGCASTHNLFRFSGILFPCSANDNKLMHHKRNE